MIEKIIHCQVALLQSTIDRLKTKSGEQTVSGALNAAVEKYLEIETGIGVN